jgi:hypothetical protein
MHSKESSTRVPTQITCKFLDSTSVAWAEEGGGIIGVNRIPSTFVFRHFLTRRENRGGPSVREGAHYRERIRAVNAMSYSLTDFS